MLLFLVSLQAILLLSLVFCGKKKPEEIAKESKSTAGPPPATNQPDETKSTNAGGNGGTEPAAEPASKDEPKDAKNQVDTQSTAVTGTEGTTTAAGGGKSKDDKEKLQKVLEMKKQADENQK